MYSNLENKMKQLLTILAITGLLSCGKKKGNENDVPTVYGVQKEDKGMTAASKKANETITRFKEALQSKKPEAGYFALKTRFETDNGGEHIWVSKIELKDDKYFGVIDNLPTLVKNVKVGDTIQIANDNISDWMYIEDKKLRGGYTIRLLRNRMTEPERKKFDEQNGLIIED